jgi:D-alanyl-D-alanine carboxypeptidase
MLRIRTGARDGLRWGLFGFVAVVLTLTNDAIHAAPYADIVVDANSGAVLHATNPDERRHPASLTKIMTLYLLFEQLEGGKLKLDSALKVSSEAAGQAPTKLGLKPGSTLSVEDAIKGMVTRSANDAAAVVAEAIAGSESDFAKLMTHKAQALGMKGTVYKNASGLPDDDQVTTARDQSVLGRAIQERFPRYYKYFSIRSFTFRGQSIANHNHLLGKVEGVDGIKTGYIGASGFNLVTSVHRGNRYLVAVVMGGSSGASRDARMRELINEKIALASVKRTATMVAEGAERPAPEPVVASKPERKPEPMVVTKAEPNAEPKVVAKAEPKPDMAAKPKPDVAAKPEATAAPKTKAEPRFAVASAISVPARFNPAGTSSEGAHPEPVATLTQARVDIGSTEPIQPVLVKTLAVRAGTKIAPIAQVASVAVEPPSAVAPAAVPALAAKPEAELAPVAAAVSETAPPPAPSAIKPVPAPAPVDAAKSEPGPQAPAAAVKAEPTPSSPTPAAKAEPSTSAVATKAPPTPAIEAPAERPPAAAVKLQSATAATAPAAAKPQPAPPLASASAATTAPAKPAAPATKPAVQVAKHRPGWMIQVGAYPAEQAAKQRLSSVQSQASKMLTGAEAFTETVDKGGTTYYRARFAGLDKDKAEAACKYLKKNDVDCVTIKN